MLAQVQAPATQPLRQKGHPGSSPYGCLRRLLRHPASALQFLSSRTTQIDRAGPAALHLE